MLTPLRSFPSLSFFGFYDDDGFVETVIHRSYKKDSCPLALITSWVVDVVAVVLYCCEKGKKEHPDANLIIIISCWLS